MTSFAGKNGWIKVPRAPFSDREHPLHPSTTRHEVSYREAWVDLLMLAVWAPDGSEQGGYSTPRGACHGSRSFFEERWGWTQSKVSRFLKKLEKHGEIDRKTFPGTGRPTLIRIAGYHEFQAEPPTCGNCGRWKKSGVCPHCNDERIGRRCSDTHTDGSERPPPRRPRKPRAPAPARSPRSPLPTPPSNIGIRPKTMKARTAAIVGILVWLAQARGRAGRKSVAPLKGGATTRSGCHLEEGDQFVTCAVRESAQPPRSVPGAKPRRCSHQCTRFVEFALRATPGPRSTEVDWRPRP